MYSSSHRQGRSHQTVLPTCDCKVSPAVPWYGQFLPCFIPKAAELARPLYQALVGIPKSRKLVRRDQMVQAFKDTKDALAKQTLLLVWFPDSPFPGDVPKFPEIWGQNRGRGWIFVDDWGKFGTGTGYLTGKFWGKLPGVPQKLGWGRGRHFWGILGTIWGQGQNS